MEIATTFCLNNTQTYMEKNHLLLCNITSIL
nr:MAG TPA: hypothetical protein [Caudoviricetes sp.]